MGSRKCVHDAAPDVSSPPPNEAVVASGVRTERRRQIAPRCSGTQDPEDAIEDTTVVNPRNAARLVRQHRLDGNPLIIGEFVAHDSSPQLGNLNHGGLPRRNGSGQAPAGRLRGRCGHQPADNLRSKPSKMTQSRHRRRVLISGLAISIEFGPLQSPCVSEFNCTTIRCVGW